MKRQCVASPLVEREESPPSDECDIVPPMGISGQLDPVSGFKPSRGRQSDLLLCMAAAGKQPSGKAPPSLLPEFVFSLRDHVGFARALRPRRTLVKAAVPQFGWNLAAKAANQPNEVRAMRHEPWRNCAHMLRALSRQKQFGVSVLMTHTHPGT